MSLFNEEEIIKTKENICLNGMTDEFFVHYLNDLFKKRKESLLLVSSTLYEANKLYNNLREYSDDVLLFPMDDYISSQSIAVSPDLMMNRLETMNELLENSKKIVVAHLDSYLRALPDKKKYEKAILKIKTNENYDRDKLIEDLINLGYKREAVVEQTAEIAVRGYVLDIFPINEEHPIRIEFFDDEIESIRIFDVDSQRTINKVSQVNIYPSSDDFIVEKESSIADYLDKKITVFKDYSRIKAAYTKLKEDIFEIRGEDKNVLELEKISLDQTIYYDSLNNYSDIKGIKNYSFDVKEAPEFNEDIAKINNYLGNSIALKKTVLIFLREKQIKKLIDELNVPYNLVSLNKFKKEQVNIIEKNLKAGFIYKDTIVLTEKEIFRVESSKKTQYKTRFKYSTKIKDSSSLEIGDYVVHNVHGIGIYNGITTISKNKLLKDYIEVLFLGNDKLYIPVERIDLISKFSSKEGYTPKINRLGGTEWQKTKRRVRERVKNIADRLIKLYAMRESSKGFAFLEDSEYQMIFENEFEHSATADQLLASKQIKEDMEKEMPMDRLLCGDVGYGKTEVAFRAIFKAVLNSKQVMYLCPTTILSKQQYNSAIERFSKFPVTIALLNRFKTKKEAKQILEDFANKKIDVLIGTHRILSEDVKAKDLGLLIIDEEQRFGVMHKEKIKEIKENVDVLTLSATPIPRTLQMSLLGIRNLSLIETPPINRYPVQTYVIEENDKLLAESIYKEMSRGGQVFILYNKINDIEERQRKIQKLVPEAKIINAHGQLSKIELENRMGDFVDGKYDVLLCTTIIETGIDIPNVNTLIVLNADHFGLSQLYQIRGRVGRSDRIAYAYLMYNPQKVLTEQAIKRLNVIKEFTELGSGFKIASRDLSIRGAGDILGSEQAGFIDTVGIDLYLQILEAEINKLKGKETKEAEEEAKSEQPFIEVTTHISDDYVEDQELKIEIHKLINTIDSQERFNEVKSELEDRFGKLSQEILVYMYQEYFDKIAKKLGVIEVKENKTFVEVIFPIDSPINRKELFEKSYKSSNQFRLKEKRNRFSLILDTIKLEKHYIYYLLDLFKQLNDINWPQ